MSTPTATPRTDDEETPLITNHRVSAETYKRMVDFARTLETELAAAKAECERLMNQRDNLLKPLRARAEDRADAADEKVERLTSENEKLTIERDALANGSAIEIAQLRAELERADVLYQRSCEVEHALRAEVKRWQAEAEEMSAQRSHNANQAGRLRAELAVAENWVEHHSKHADDLIAENVKLRAEVEALKQSIESGQRVLREDAERNAARAERAEAALAEWSVLNLWGGTPEIIHEFIKGQQNRIHHCQDLEAELAEAVDGEINGGSIPDTLLVIHVPRSPVGYRVGQPVKVILPAIDAAMKP